MESNQNRFKSFLAALPYSAVGVAPFLSPATFLPTHACVLSALHFSLLLSQAVARLRSRNSS